MSDTKTSKELWAVVDKNNEVVWSRGGSSTAQKLMVYESEQKAKTALNNKWIKQVHDSKDLEIIKIYSPIVGVLINQLKELID